MIKKKIFSMVLGLVPCLLLVPSITSAYTCTNQGNYCYDLELGETYSEFTGNKYIGKVSDSYFNFGGNVFEFNSYYNQTTYRRFGAMRRQSDGLYFTRQNYNASNKVTGKNQGFFVCSAMPTSNALLKNDNSCEFYTNYVDLKTYITNANRYMYNCGSSTDSNRCNICIYEYGGGDYICIDYGSYYTVESNTFLTADEISARAIQNPFTTPTPTPRPNTPNTNIYCPTIGQLIKNYGENYNTGLCYNNTLYFNNETLQFETVEQEDIFTIFTNYTTFKNRQSIYNSNCGTPYTANSCSNAFSGEYKKYSILSNMINAKVDEKKLWNYCNMALNYDLNATTCVASGVIAEPPTRDEFLDSIIRGDYTVVTPNSGNIYDNLLTGNQTRETETQRDVFGAMDRIYTKITGLFKDRKGVQGIIPEYIMRICYISILFIVLFKKG